MVRLSAPSGLELFVEPVPGGDIVAVQVWVDVGSEAEPAGHEGVAHVVEHMVFKGTDSFGVGEVAGAIEGVGGDVNAYTSFDETVFYASTPVGGLPTTLRVLGEMLGRARLDPAEWAREREVILEELRGGDDDLHRLVGEAAYALAWPDHPYGRPIIGSHGSVSALDVGGIRAFYEAWYQPGNTRVAVVGPVDVAEVSALVAGCFDSAPRPRRVRGPAPVSRSGRQRTLRRGFDTCVAELGWAVPGHGHPDLPALDVACTALGGAASSPLEVRLRLRDRSCLDAGLHAEAEASAGMVVLALHPREGALVPALDAALEELARARAEGVAEEHVGRARAQILADRVFGRQTVDGRAASLVFHAARYGDPEAHLAYDAAVRAVTPADVTRVLRTWLAPGRENRIYHLPEGVPAPSRRSAARLAPPPPAAPRAPARSAEPVRHLLPNGVRVLLEPDDSEVVSFVAAGLGGALLERPERAGHGAAWARAVSRGTTRQRPEDFAAAVEAVGGSFGAVSGRSSQYLRADFTAETGPAGLQLFLDALLSPAFDADEVRAIRAELLEAWEERDDHPHARLGELLWARAFDPHPYGLPSGGTRASLRAVGPARLRALHRAWCVPPNLVISVAGGFEPERVLRALTWALGGLRGAAPALPAPPATDAGPRGEATARAGREQAHLALAFPGARVGAPEGAALDLVITVLGGQGGRLFREVREERGLVYDVSASHQEALHPGLAVASLATDPARLPDAEHALRAAIRRIVEEGPDDAEVERARRWLLASVDHDLQTAAARAVALAYGELYGTGWRDYAGVARARILGVDRAAAWEAARRHLSEPVAVARVYPREGRR